MACEEHVSDSSEVSGGEVSGRGVLWRVRVWCVRVWGRSTSAPDRPPAIAWSPARSQGGEDRSAADLSGSRPGSEIFLPALRSNKKPRWPSGPENPLHHGARERA